MKLKSYFAATVEAAMNMARLELGSEAMLVSTTRTAGETRHLGEYEVVFATATHHDARAIDAVGQNQKKAPPIDKLSDEVAGLKHEMERLASALSRSSAGIASIAANPHLAEVFSQLVAAELDRSVAQDIVSRISIAVRERRKRHDSSRCSRLHCLGVDSGC